MLADVTKDRTRGWMGGIGRLLPGLALCVTVAAAATALAAVEKRIAGEEWLEPLVLAIIIGVLVRSFWTPGDAFRAGIDFSAKPLLEVAIVLLGASLTAATLLAAGPLLLAGIVAVVATVILVSYGIGRLLGLPPRLATLVACGNSICGNSAIAAAAPIIGADSRDVAASIAFTAVLGVVVVLTLPLLVPLLGLSHLQYGVLAGLTVYAVPQVLAATAPIGAVSVQMGTLVKLVRVLMLGPVLLCLGFVANRGGPARLSLKHLVPWFIVGFLLLAGARSFGLVPAPAAAVAATVSGWLTILSMAALGLGVDIRTVARAGGPVTAAVIASLVILCGISLLMIRFIGIG